MLVHFLIAISYFPVRLSSIITWTFTRTRHMNATLRDVIRHAIQEYLSMNTRGSTLANTNANIKDAVSWVEATTKLNVTISNTVSNGYSSAMNVTNVSKMIIHCKLIPKHSTLINFLTYHTWCANKRIVTSEPNPRKSSLLIRTDIYYRLSAISAKRDFETIII